VIIILLPVEHNLNRCFKDNDCMCCP